MDVYVYVSVGVYINWTGIGILGRNYRNHVGKERGEMWERSCFYEESQFGGVVS
jgi:hypothetical protein